MHELAPYLTSIVCSLLAFLSAVVVCRRNNKADLEKIKEQHNLELEKIRVENENKAELLKKETEAKIEVLKQEYALKTGTNMIAAFMDKTTDAVFDTPAVKQKLNQQAAKSFVSNQSKKRRK